MPQFPHTSLYGNKTTLITELFQVLNKLIKIYHLGKNLTQNKQLTNFSY